MGNLFDPGPAKGQGVADAGARLGSQRDVILALLLDHGQTGITNIELNKVAFRYGGRIFELRRMGHAIETAPEGGGVFRFTLRPGLAREPVGEQGRSPSRRGSQTRQRAANPTMSTSGADEEVAGGQSTGPGEPYSVGSPDFRHALLLHKKFAEHIFRVNARGEAVCPACGAGMQRAEKKESLAPHFVCPRALGMVFYGDREGLRLCLNPEIDAAEQVS